MSSNFGPGRSTKGASKQRREQINGEIDQLKILLPLPDSIRQRLFQLQVMSLACIFIRRQRYIPQILKNGHALKVPPGLDITKTLRGFLLLVTRHGKLIYLSENVADYLGHSVEEITSQGDSFFDLIDSRDHAMVQQELLSAGEDFFYPQGGARFATSTEHRVFVCRVNMSRAAKRQPHYQRCVFVQGQYLESPSPEYLSPSNQLNPVHHPLPGFGLGGSCSQLQPVFAALCTPLITPETTELMTCGNTTIFNALHHMDMRFLEIDDVGIYHLGYGTLEIIGQSWYTYVFPDDLREAGFKHKLLCEEKETSCSLLIRLRSWSGAWIWLYTILSLKDGTTEQSVRHFILGTYQMLNETEARLLKDSGWLSGAVTSKLSQCNTTSTSTGTCTGSGVASDTQTPGSYEASSNGSADLNTEELNSFPNRNPRKSEPSDRVIPNQPDPKGSLAFPLSPVEVSQDGEIDGFNVGLDSNNNRIIGNENKHCITSLVKENTQLDNSLHNGFPAECSLKLEEQANKAASGSSKINTSNDNHAIQMKHQLFGPTVLEFGRPGPLGSNSKIYLTNPDHFDPSLSGYPTSFGSMACNLPLKLDSLLTPETSETSLSDESRPSPQTTTKPTKSSLDQSKPNSGAGKRHHKKSTTLRPAHKGLLAMAHPKQKSDQHDVMLSREICISNISDADNPATKSLQTSSMTYAISNPNLTGPPPLIYGPGQASGAKWHMSGDYRASTNHWTNVSKIPPESPYPMAFNNRPIANLQSNMSYKSMDPTLTGSSIPLPSDADEIRHLPPSLLEPSLPVIEANDLEAYLQNVEDVDDDFDDNDAIDDVGSLAHNDTSRDGSSDPFVSRRPQQNFDTHSDSSSGGGVQLPTMDLDDEDDFINHGPHANRMNAHNNSCRRNENVATGIKMHDYHSKQASSSYADKTAASRPCKRSASFLVNNSAHYENSSLGLPVGQSSNHHPYSTNSINLRRHSETNVVRFYMNDQHNSALEINGSIDSVAPQEYCETLQITGHQFPC